MPTQNAGTGNSAPENVRHRAAGILSLGKLRMLDTANIAVVDQDRLEALKRVARLAAILRDKDGKAGVISFSTTKLALWASIEELEAMESDSVPG